MAGWGGAEWGARIGSVGFAFACRTANGFRRSRLMLACGWVGRRRQAGWRQEENEEEDGRRGGRMEGWKGGEERQGALEGRGIKGLERGCFYEVKSVVR
jgi:hypothetical protein